MINTTLTGLGCVIIWPMPHKDPDVYRIYHQQYTQQRLDRARTKKLCEKCNGKIKGDGHTKCENCRTYNREACAKTNAKTKTECFDAYGGKCACCGEANYVFLTIDHKNGGGNKHRRELAIQHVKNPMAPRKAIGIFGGVRMYRWLRKNKWPKEFQLLCWNCNMAKRQNSRCPHDR